MHGSVIFIAQLGIFVRQHMPTSSSSQPIGLQLQSWQACLAIHLGSPRSRCLPVPVRVTNAVLLWVQGCVPFWPSVLAQLTGFSEAGCAPFTSAISLAEVACEKLLSATDANYAY